MLIEQKEDLNDKKENELTAHSSLRDATDELSTIDNHPADLATEMHEREKDLAFKVHHEDLQSDVNAALERMEDGTYGQCLTCHSDIPYERLQAIPHTAFCIEHSETTSIPTDRPIEEEVLLPPIDNSFSGRDKDEGDSLQDDEDTFRIVAQYGNSDTPADFEGDFDDYNDLYNDKSEHNDLFTELDILHVSEEDQLHGQISQKYADEARWNDYSE